jgi:hypothetical protein
MAWLVTAVMLTLLPLCGSPTTSTEPRDLEVLLPADRPGRSLQQQQKGKVCMQGMLRSLPNPHNPEASTTFAEQTFSQPPSTLHVRLGPLRLQARQCSNGGTTVHHTHVMLVRPPRAAPTS